LFEGPREKRTVYENKRREKLTFVIMFKGRFALADSHAFDEAVYEGEDMQQLYSAA
jgi:hypothetical protein